MQQEREKSRVCLVAPTFLPEPLGLGPHLLDELCRAPDGSLQGRRKSHVSRMDERQGAYQPWALDGRYRGKELQSKVRIHS